MHVHDFEPIKVDSVSRGKKNSTRL